MRASRAFAVTAAACAAVALAAPTAAATNGPSNVTVNPYSVHQGSTMQVSAAGCGHGGMVTSNAFPQAHLSAGATGYATARIKHNATPGHYNLAVKCNDNSMVSTHQFTVLAGRGAQGGLGGSVGPSDTEMAVGAGLVATAALGGGLFIARRRRLNGAGI
ncbi:hypothetical protein [Streptomyces sp. H27-C3]|uniref:hypothetical protein n=1 Tax=Streptomyces sp. H27-C3 TaxID=3046305 RepID=UPI0024BA7A52|nr:hypothetical protein [Streptomyces sp. H27-C3]MDJ0465319.1 hypothetical protein [Streptomyces sp. H27-C3]